MRAIHTLMGTTLVLGSCGIALTMIPISMLGQMQKMVRVLYTE